MEMVKPSRMLAHLPFAQAFGVIVTAEEPGAVVVEAPYIEDFSAPKGQFPAFTVGALGDIAAVSSCMSRLPIGWATATLDFTVKMTGPAIGSKLIARGRCLQSGKTFSVGAAEIFVVQDRTETLCGSVLSSARSYQIK